MKLLIADDDTLFRMLLRQTLASDYELEIVDNGDAASSALQRDDAPQLAILDWIMPGLSGPQVCRNVRSRCKSPGPYLLLFIARNNVAEMIAGLQAGADDYVTKPFNPEELRARVHVGRRIVELQSSLESQIAATRNALTANELLQKTVLPCNLCQLPQADPEFLRRVRSLLQALPEDSPKPDPLGVQPSTHSAD